MLKRALLGGSSISKKPEHEPHRLLVLGLKTAVTSLVGARNNHAIRASSKPRTGNPERSTVTRRDHPPNLRRWHRAIHFRQAFGWVIRPAVGTATISCSGRRRRVSNSRYGHNAGCGDYGKNDGCARNHTFSSQGSAGSHFRENHTFQGQPNQPPSGDPAGPMRQRRTSQRSRAQRPDRPSHLCSVASYRPLHSAPVIRQPRGSSD